MSAALRRKPTTLDPLVISLIATRHAYGLSLRTLGVKVGLSASAICEWETGRHEPTIANLRAWARGLGLEPTLLLAADLVAPRDPKAEGSPAAKVVAAAVEARNALAALMASLDATRPGVDLTLTDEAKRQRAAYGALWAAVDEYAGTATWTNGEAES